MEAASFSTNGPRFSAAFSPSWKKLKPRTNRHVYCSVHPSGMTNKQTNKRALMSKSGCVVCVLVLRLEVFDETLEQIGSLADLHLLNLQQVLQWERQTDSVCAQITRLNCNKVLFSRVPEYFAGLCTHVRTSHICSWKVLLSLSMSSDESSRVSPYCFCLSFSSFPLRERERRASECAHRYQVIQMLGWTVWTRRAACFLTF